MKGPSPCPKREEKTEQDRIILKRSEIRKRSGVFALGGKLRSVPGGHKEMSSILADQ
jgi:hypothetical protein